MGSHHIFVFVQNQEMYFPRHMSQYYLFSMIWVKASCLLVDIGEIVDHDCLNFLYIGCYVHVNLTLLIMHKLSNAYNTTQHNTIM